MPPLAFKPDSSFFEKIALGAVGSRYVAQDLKRLGHQIVELERGAMDTKIWKDVKRKRVCIPDLVCKVCGLRVESRAKKRAELSMSHSFPAHERAWDFGMVDTDVVAFPVCTKDKDQGKEWCIGRFNGQTSYWHERSRIQWQPQGKVNYIRVGQFKAVPRDNASTKGVTEGSETSIVWKSRFSCRNGFVEDVSGQKITITRAGEGHRHTQTVPPEMKVAVDRGDQFALNQIIASRVRPEADNDLRCSQELTDCQLLQLLSSRERTQRFTGVKLARLRLRRSDSLTNTIASLERDQEEDVYIRLEAAACLVAICDMRVQDLFMPYLKHYDEQIQLEAVISLGEAGTQECVRMLSTILNDAERPYFARSAAAWSLSRINDSQSCQYLVQAFGDMNPNLREEALEGIVRLHSDAVPSLLSGLQEADPAIAAGCAEALRQHGALPADAINALTGQLVGENPSKWTVWLAGHLPRECLAGTVVDLQETAPELHYAITVLWSFTESWIARQWELQPGVNLPPMGDAP